MGVIDLYCTAPAQHHITAGYDLHDLSIDDISVEDLSIDDISVNDPSVGDLSAHDVSADYQSNVPKYSRRFLANSCTSAVSSNFIFYQSTGGYKKKRKKKKVVFHSRSPPYGLTVL